jgi:hypothetical protein
MADKPANQTLMPSDIIGLTIRGLTEVLGYLNSNHTEHIHGPAVVAQLERMMGFMAHIPAPKAEDKKAA